MAPAAAAEDRRLRNLAKTFKGQIIVPGSALYARVYAPYNANYPACPARGRAARRRRRRSAVVRWAAAERVPIVARSGGHSYGGYSRTPGVVVDLARLSSVQVSGTHGIVGAGARLGLVYTGLAAHGLAIPAGTCPSVGIGGHALGGGFGLATRAWGLASDNILSAQLVTAPDPGRLIAPPDLFWPAAAAAGATSGSPRASPARTALQAARTHRLVPWAQVEEVLPAFGRAPSTSDAVGPSPTAAGASYCPGVRAVPGPQNELRTLLAVEAGAEPRDRLVDG